MGNSEAIVQLIHRLEDTEGMLLEEIRNSFECIQCEIDKINVASMKNEERFIKMNAQLHYLSAKFIDFNTRMIDHIRKHQVDSPVTLPLVQAESPKENKCANQFSSNQIADNRFGNNFNHSNYSKLFHKHYRQESVQSFVH